jgi:O-glycosyl hydrolase
LRLASPPGIVSDPARILSTVAVSSTGIGEYGLGWRPALIKPGTRVAGSTAVDTAPSAERAGVRVAPSDRMSVPTASAAATMTIANTASQAALGARLPPPSVSILVAIDLASFGSSRPP